MRVKLRLLSIILSMAMVASFSGGTRLLVSRAQEAPTPPPAPEAPSAPTPPPAPEAPSAPTPPPAPEAPDSSISSLSPAPQSSPASPAPNENVVDGGSADITSDESVQVNNSSDYQDSIESQDSVEDDIVIFDDQFIDPVDMPGDGLNDDISGGFDEIGVMNEDSMILTGDAFAAGDFYIDANINSINDLGDGSGMYAQNSGNGDSSDNDIKVSGNADEITVQGNDADVLNDVELAAISGSNEASRNLNGDNVIITGDSDVSASLVNAINTNLDNVTMAEFAVEDVHMGDLVLEFPELQASGCFDISCGGVADVALINDGNGDSSDNNIGIDFVEDAAAWQQNVANLQNDMVLLADSGSNQTNLNTNGRNFIETGNANISATVANLVNNNFSAASEMLVAIVDIFGFLIGDIVLPDIELIADSNSDVLLDNSGNGADSDNDIILTSSNSAQITQANTADIVNNVTLETITGENEARSNTANFEHGDNVIESGDAYTDLSLITIANNNIVADSGWWLVFVNDVVSGWVGRILGNPEGTPYAGSQGTEFVVNENGNIEVRNTDNGAGSDNDIALDQERNTSAVQSNDLILENNIALRANTGGNKSNYNTGGSSYISTGDASVIGSILNFVNNNIKGGNLAVAIVNVFGGWDGDFVPPGYEQDEENIGGDDIELSGIQDDSGTITPLAGVESETTSSDNDIAIVSPVASYGVETGSGSSLILGGFSLNDAISSTAAMLGGTDPSPVASPLADIESYPKETVLIGGVRFNRSIIEFLSITLVLVLMRRMIWLSRKIVVQEIAV